MEPSEYKDCTMCKGRGCVDSLTGIPTDWESVSAEECDYCGGMGEVANPEHVERCKYHLRELLDSRPFLEELANSNYHSAADFLAELRDNEW